MNDDARDSGKFRKGGWSLLEKVCNAEIQPTLRAMRPKWSNLKGTTNELTLMTLSSVKTYESAPHTSLFSSIAVGISTLDPYRIK